jgi:hypothetical protein
MAQRHLALDEIEYVIRHGITYRRAGALHCYLRKKDIPAADRRQNKYSRLEGTVVLLDSRNVVMLTVYRNRHKHALKEIRSKAKYNKKKQLLTA